MFAVRRVVSAVVGTVLLPAGTVALSSPAAAVDPWRITEVATPVTGAQGTVASAEPACPSGQEVIGGDVRDMSDFRYLRVKAAIPNWGTQSYLGAVAVDGSHGSQTFTVVAYCVPSALASGMSVKQVYFNPPGGSLGQGKAGGSTPCDNGQRAVGGGAQVYDYTTSGTGFLLSSSPRTDASGWYASAQLNASSVLVEALCLPTAKVPPLQLVTKVIDNTIGSYAYFVGSPSATCPEGQQVLTGGGYTAVNGQFPNPADANQGHVAQSNSETGFWYATIGMNNGYESTTVLWCVPDTGAPTVTMTKPSIARFSERVALTASIAVAWTGSDAADFVARYQVRWRSAPYNGTYIPWQYPGAWSALTTTSLTHGSRPEGATYCYSARGTDPAGNLSAWAAQRCALRPLDDRSLAASAGWVRGSGSTYWNGTRTTSTTLGSKLTLTGVRFNQLGLLATKCPSCGQVRVKEDGAVVGTVNLANATNAYRQVIALPRTLGRAGTVTIEVITSGKPVSIDGLIVSAN